MEPIYTLKQEEVIDKNQEVSDDQRIIVKTYTKEITEERTVRDIKQEIEDIDNSIARLTARREEIVAEIGTIAEDTGLMVSASDPIFKAV